MRLYLLPVFSVLFFITACSEQSSTQLPLEFEDLENITAYPADMEPAMQIELTEERRFGSTGEVLVGGVGSMTVDGRDRVFIFDTRQQTIHVFDKNGNYVTNIGREGAGPGEFSLAAALHSKNRKLFVHDPFLFRLTVFSLDSFELDYTFSSNRVNTEGIEPLEGLKPDSYHFMSGDKYLVRFSSPIVITDPASPHYNLNDRFELFYLMDSSGRILSDEVFRQAELRALTANGQGEFKNTQFKFLGESLFALSDDNEMYTARTEDFLIEVRDSAGTYRRAFYHPVKKRPFSRDEAIKIQKEKYEKFVADHRTDVISNAPNKQIPGWWPVLGDMLVDDESRLWVAVVGNDPEVYEWWVLQDTGELLARFDWPRDKEIREVKNGKLYTLETEEETGLEEVVRYRIEMSN